jgi:hypothetical protein
LGDSLDLLESNLLEVRQKQSTSWGGAERHKEERARRKRRLTRWSIHADGAKVQSPQGHHPLPPRRSQVPLSQTQLTRLTLQEKAHEAFAMGSRLQLIAKVGLWHLECRDRWGRRERPTQI